MKLNLTLEELEFGARIRRMGKKQSESLSDAIANRRAVALSPPLRSNGKNYTIMFPTSMTTRADRMHEVKFVPVAPMAYQVLDKDSREINLLVIQVDGVQLAVTREGAKSSGYTLSGAGVDSEAEPNPTELLPKLVNAKAVHPVVKNAVQALYSMQVEKQSVLL